MIRAAAFSDKPLQASVSVHIFPKDQPTEITRAAALHLFRLLQRYNWCLAGQDYRARWLSFWPCIQSIERVLLVLLVKASCDGVFGRRLVAIDPPVDFERFIDVEETDALMPEVKREFGQLLDAYYSRLGSRSEVYAWLRKDCPKEFALLMASRPLRTVFGTRAWIDPELVYETCKRAFHSDGWELGKARAWAKTLARSVLAFYASQEVVR